MTEDDYDPYYLEKINRQGQEYLILEISPINNRPIFDNFIHEIHIKSGSITLDFLEQLERISKNSIPICISPENDDQTLEIIEGDYYEESYVNLTLKYESFEKKEIEKAPVDWEIEFIELKKRYYLEKGIEKTSLEWEAEIADLKKQRFELSKANIPESERIHEQINDLKKLLDELNRR
jgi:hypothetical protein